MFSIAFAGYYDTNTSYLFSDSVQGENAGQDANVAMFSNLFGCTRDDVNGCATYGLYKDENNILRLMGVWDATAFNLTRVFGLEYTGTYKPDIPESSMGIYLVQDTSVIPVPAVAWLFSSGLLGLLGAARCKMRR